MSNWEQNEDVQLYLNEEAPTRDQCANAFYIRDTIGYVLSFAHIRNYVLTKLGLNNIDDYVNNAIVAEGISMFKQQFNTEVVSYDLGDYDNYNTNSTEDYTINYTLNIVLNKILNNARKKKERFDELKDYTDTKTLYDNLTIDEFNYLGW
jgi:hypothetical protein